MCGGFSHIKQLDNTSWVSYRLIPTLPVVSERFQKLRGLTRLLPPKKLQKPITNAGCQPCFWVIGYKSEVPITPSSGLISLLEWFTDSWRKEKATYCLPLYCKRIQQRIQMTSRRKARVGQSRSEAAQGFHALWGSCHSLSTCMCSTTWKLFEPPYILGSLLEASSHRHDGSVTSFSAPPPSLKNGLELKILSF